MFEMIWMKIKRRQLSAKVITIIITLCCFFILEYPYILGGPYSYHDSIAALTNLFVFYNRIFSGHWWLWSSALNAGQPLWPVVETMPICDPVAVLVWALGYFAGLDAVTTFQLTCCIWLLLFSFGAYLVARLYARTVWGPALALLLCLIGPIALAMPAQSYGFLIPFRYLPICIYCYWRLIYGGRLREMMLLGAAVALSWSGYQSILLMISLLVFGLAHVAILLWRSKIEVLYRHLFHLVGATFISILTLLPTLVFVAEAHDYVAIPRKYEPFAVYYLSIDRIISDVFGPLVQLSGAVVRFSTWHGSYWIGLLPVIFVVVAAARVFGDLGSGRSKCSKLRIDRSFYGGDLVPTFFLFAAIISVIAAAIGFRQRLIVEGAVLDFRNWGFLLTSGVFGLVQLSAAGFDRFCASRAGSLVPSRSVVVVVAIVALGSSYFVGGVGVARGIVAAAGVVILCSILRLSVRYFSDQLLLDARFWIFIIVAGGTLNFSLAHNRNFQGALKAFGMSYEAPWFGPERLSEQYHINRLRFVRVKWRFTQRRDWTSDLTSIFPFQLEYPETVQRDVAYINPQLALGYAVAVPAVKITHQFELVRYAKLVQIFRRKGDNEVILKRVLGVDHDILYAADRTVIAHSADEALDELSSNLHDGVVVVEADGRQARRLREFMVSSIAHRTPFQHQITVTGFRPGLLEARIYVNRPCMIVYSDNYAKGWLATVDGKRANVWVANVTNKAVLVPQGHHIIKFMYWPKYYVWSFFIRLLVTGLLLTYIVYSLMGLVMNVQKGCPTTETSPAGD